MKPPPPVTRIRSVFTTLAPSGLSYQALEATSRCQHKPCARIASDVHRRGREGPDGAPSTRNEGDENGIPLIQRLASHATDGKIRLRNRHIGRCRVQCLRTARQRNLAANIYLGSSTANRERELQAAFDHIGLDKELSTPRKVFVKPNFTFPRPVPGVTTSREMLEDTLALLVERGAEVFVGESNGGYGSFTAAEAFAGQGLFDMCKRTGAQPLDLSKCDLKEYSSTIGGKEVSVRLARMLAEEMDFTVSLPVLKVHAMTTVSLSMKNLWGCYPTDLRLLEHKELDRKLALISKLIKARFGIVDATYGLDKHGPMEGEARFLGKFIASNDLLALDTACARMMGFSPSKLLHLRELAEFTGQPLDSPTTSNEDLTTYNWGFSLQRDLIDSLSFLCFHSDTLAKVVFDSPFTPPIYAMLGRKPHRKLA